ncbi:MAG: hypothetical protein LBP21_04620 [Synergistaceae bacterium]|jgi:anthranilate phosphoribosyltransferase|nr:hypothetical protein [Synergistaceae bacterium]
METFMETARQAGKGRGIAEVLHHKLMSGARLAREESAALFDAVIRGELNDVEIAALLVALKLCGETAEEIAIRSVLAGQGSEAHAAVISVNAAALLTLGGVTENYRDGFALAMSVLKSGLALERLEKFAAMSRAPEKIEEGLNRVCA